MKAGNVAAMIVRAAKSAEEPSVTLLNCMTSFPNTKGAIRSKENVSKCSVASSNETS